MGLAIFLPSSLLYTTAWLSLLIYPWAEAGVMLYNFLFILYNKLGRGKNCQTHGSYNWKIQCFFIDYLISNAIIPKFTVLLCVLDYSWAEVSVMPCNFLLILYTKLDRGKKLPNPWVLCIFSGDSTDIISSPVTHIFKQIVWTIRKFNVFSKIFWSNTIIPILIFLLCFLVCLWVLMGYFLNVQNYL